MLHSSSTTQPQPPPYSPGPSLASLPTSIAMASCKSECLCRRSRLSYAAALVGCMLIFIIIKPSAAASFKPTPWKLAHATFYGDESASSTMGGACGYGNQMDNGYGTNTAALSTVLFHNGYACGTCFEMRCTQSPWCIGYGSSITVTATNLCPPNWYQDGNNGGWCNPPREHFDLTEPAFVNIAQKKAGIVPVMYRRVPCARKGGLRFSFQGNPYWLLVYVTNVGDGGDIYKMWVKGSQTGWIAMTHNWGASFQAFSQLGGQPLSFKITSLTTKKTVTANNVAPAYWASGKTYSSSVNFS